VEYNGYLKKKKYKTKTDPNNFITSDLSVDEKHVYNLNGGRGAKIYHLTSADECYISKPLL